VARIIDVDTASNGAPYIVLEYLDGRDLNQVLREQKQLAVAVAVEFVLQAAEALAEAHSLGIVHRDLKPANLFLTTRADGSPLIKVLDFGISKAMASGERGITSTQAVMGSPGYMSPEQVRSSKHVDQRTDVWSLGVILYEFLSGVPPFDGESVPALSAQIVTETPQALPSLRSEIPPALDLVVQRCLAKDVGQRYHNMAELARALSAFASSSAQVIVERIVRIASTSAAHAPTLTAEAGPSGFAPTELAQQVATQGGGWAQTKPGSPQQRRWLFAAALVMGVAGVLTAVFLAGQRSADSDEPTLASTTADTPASTRASASQVPPSVHAAPAAPAIPSMAPLPSSPAPSAVASSSGPVSPPVVTNKATRQATSRAAQCAKGQSLSNGHCCPNGLTWQNGRCDRPLATTLP
jgi:serine/threonine-protein kinase